MTLAAIVPDWPAPPTIRALSSHRAGGVSTGRYAELNLGAHVGDDPKCVAENWRRLRGHFRLPSNPAWLAQVHGIRVADLDAADTSDTSDMSDAADAVAGTAKAREADASMTRRPNRVCAILTADCLPVLFTDVDGSCVAAAHAGWRGLLDGVLEAAARSLPAAPDRLLAWLGPAIGPRHFEVGAEVREQFVAEERQCESAFVGNERGRYFADLFELARRRLRRAGVVRVFGGGECTYADAARYFSYRRDGVTGRQATLIWRTGP